MLDFITIYGAGNRVGIGLSYRPARLRIGSLESILGLLKSLKIRALVVTKDSAIAARRVHKCSI